VPWQKDVIPREVVVVPQGQGVIPRRPRGGASCKGIIPRRPRGDASLLGHNSTATWWCLIMRIRIVKSWGLICFDSSGVMLVIYDWLWDYMWTVIIWNSFTLAYPFACLYVVCGLLYCNDHQFYWCEQMWGPLAVIWIIGMRQLDGWDEYWAHYGAHHWRILFNYVSFVRTRLSIVICFFSVLCLDRVEPLLCNLGKCLAYCMPAYSKLRTLWLFMYVTFYQFEVIQFLGRYI